ncbi:DUF4388 domain-containing protein [Tengunoibacter tsumagoiensis]|uniref:PatA-like N-terminal domain-containing protein n=1 Tax=Tengunoibacter tsumagoiensis TaxID=2014871 RepID=A0A401ZZT9_9CHLR|nr:DUF4388 domain-containing protein [Tengunoibacter tsumagoiensis]GCE12346.1 hypothetical protein KTT_22050 [Tengunoibacter tsumagoiensis]
MAQKGIPTDQLNNVIQVIQLGRKTGILLVERGEGGQLEKGMLQFVQGSITDARCNTFQGQAALNWLQTWQACRFIFTPNTNTVDQQNTASAPWPSQQTPPSARAPNTPKGFEPTQGRPPQRTYSADDGLALLTRAGLSRSHRHLFLLIDGRRTYGELIRLMGRSSEEVLQLLHDLDALGIIHS